MGVAIGAFSGGLDSILAARTVLEQGLDVILVTMHSPFFEVADAPEYASQLDAQWRSYDFTEVIIGLLRDPPSGFGSRMNPCIDCHAAMFSILGRICDTEGLDFVFSGEVLGQRPMSQNPGSLNRVARLAGLEGRLVRPLSAKLLEETIPEREGLVDREGLLDIQGRSRKRQMKLAEEYGLSYRQPGGGCLLTDPGYSTRLIELIESELLDPTNARLIRAGRMFVLDDRSAVALVGRSKLDNDRLEEAADGQIMVRLADRPGPTGVIIGFDLEDDHLAALGSLVAHYGKVPPGEMAVIDVSNGDRIEVESTHQPAQIPIRRITL